MDLQTKQLRIKELLSQNLFLNKKNHTRFLAVAESDHETNIDTVLSFLIKANAQERKAVKEKLESDPNFFSELKHGAYMKVLTDIKQKESAETLKEQDIFADLETELVNL